MAKAEDLILMRQLADALGGEIGCTRPISEELQWLPADCCIGLPGVQIKPDFFLALWVSGQIQHVTGVRGAKVIAAVNRDENAPTFGVAEDRGYRRPLRCCSEALGGVERIVAFPAGGLEIKGGLDNRFSLSL